MADRASTRTWQGLPWLVADIGGTNARFGLIEEAGGTPGHVRSLPVADHAGPAAAVADYLSQVASQRANPLAPRRTALAVATAVHADEIALTNGAWRFSRAELQRELQLERLLMLNDFEALALALPRLVPAQTRPIGPPRAATPGVMAVIGPGTGLGVGGVVPLHEDWVALSGEGGHATLAPADDVEGELLRHVRRTHAHVSAERLLSGIGLPLLHQAVGAVTGRATPALSTEQIVERGREGQDAVSVETIEHFCAMLGGFAGNVALTLGARGGVFVGGGIVPRLGERFFRSRFRERFEAKGRAEAYLTGIPTWLITDTLAALSGAALALEQLRD